MVNCEKPHVIKCSLGYTFKPILRSPPPSTQWRVCRRKPLCYPIVTTFMNRTAYKFLNLCNKIYLCLFYIMTELCVDIKQAEFKKSLWNDKGFLTADTIIVSVVVIKLNYEWRGLIQSHENAILVNYIVVCYFNPATTTTGVVLGGGREGKYSRAVLGSAEILGAQIF